MTSSIIIRSCSRALGKQLFFVAVTCTATLSQGVENGAPITPFGVANFGAGMMPPASVGLTAAFRVSTYRATEQRDGSGDRSPIGIKLRVNSAAVAIIKTTDLPLLGGTYGFSAVLPFLDMTNGLTVSTPAGPSSLRGTNAALGDVTVVPLMVKWTPSPNLFINGRLEFQLPTGSYQRDRIINTGVNHATVSPAFALTWISASGLEVSSNIQLNIHRRNRANQYRSGVEFQHEFAVGQHVGPWTLGVGGYLYQQITDDKVDGRKFQDGNRARAFALGPAVSFLEQGSSWPAISAHVYKEFGARNRAQGAQVAVRAAWSF